MSKKFYSLSVLLCLILLSLLTGQVDSFFLSEKAYQGYQFLQKPLWTPPAFIFPLIGTAFYMLIGLAAWLVWRSKEKSDRKAGIYWTVQLFLQAIWTPLFFGRQEILAGLILIIFVIFFVLMTVLQFYKSSRLAGLLMGFYLIWVSFIGILNFMIWQMNGS